MAHSHILDHNWIESGTLGGCGPTELNPRKMLSFDMLPLDTMVERKLNSSAGAEYFALLGN